MSDQHPTAVNAAIRLREALERAADAFASPDLDTLLACEPALELAVAGLPHHLKDLSAAERELVRAELTGAHAAMLRCRRLGGALSDFIRLSFEAHGRSPSYGRPEALDAGRAFSERV